MHWFHYGISSRRYLNVILSFRSRQQEIYNRQRQVWRALYKKADQKIRVSMIHSKKATFRWACERFYYITLLCCWTLWLWGFTRWDDKGLYRGWLVRCSLIRETTAQTGTYIRVCHCQSPAIRANKEAATNGPRRWTKDQIKKSTHFRRCGNNPQRQTKYTDRRHEASQYAGGKIPGHSQQHYPAKQATCHECQKRGHLQKMCKTRKIETFSKEENNKHVFLGQ